MIVEFIEPALIELDDAIEFYNLQIQGLGSKFLAELLSVIKLISAFPSAWTKYSKNTYKATLKKFPYSIIFTVLDNKIFIVAIAHHHREPEYWMDRFIE